MYFTSVTGDLKNQNINVELYAINDRFILGNKEFILSGALEFQISESGNKDYTAYCRSVEGYRSRKKNNLKYRKKFQKKKMSDNLAILFYISANKILNIN